MAFNASQIEQRKHTAALVFHEHCTLSRVFAAWRRAHRRAVHLQHVQRSGLPHFIHQRNTTASAFKAWVCAFQQREAACATVCRLGAAVARWRRRHAADREAQLQLEHAQHRMNRLKASHALHKWRTCCRTTKARRRLRVHLEATSRMAAVGRGLRRWAAAAAGQRQAREQHYEAVHFAETVRQKRVFAAWLNRTRESRQLRCAVLHHCCRVQARAWAAWRWAAHRKQLMRTTTMRVVRHVRLQVQASAFAELRRHACAAGARRAAVRACMLRGRAETAVAAIRQWAAYSRGNGRVRRQAALLAARVQGAAVACALRAWQRWAAGHALRRRALETGVKLERKQGAKVAQRCLAVWLQAAQGQRGRLHRLQQVAEGAAARRLLCSALGRWRHAGRIQATLRGRCMSRAFSAWALQVQRAAALRRASVAAEAASILHRRRRTVRRWRHTAHTQHQRRASFACLLPCMLSLHLGAALWCAAPGDEPARVVARALLRWRLQNKAPGSAAQTALYLPNAWTWRVRRVVALVAPRASLQVACCLQLTDGAQPAEASNTQPTRQPMLTVQPADARVSASRPLLQALASARRATAESAAAQRRTLAALRALPPPPPLAAHGQHAEGMRVPAILHTQRQACRRLSGTPPRRASSGCSAAATSSSRARPPPRKLQDGE